jgi:hypothetical protein
MHLIKNQNTTFFNSQGVFIDLLFSQQNKHFFKVLVTVLGKHNKITLKYFPANNCTPIIAKISQKMRHTNSTLKMDGIACTNALTTT